MGRVAPWACADGTDAADELSNAIGDLVQAHLHGYGLGFFNRIGPAVGMLLAFVIYTLQVLWSRWWFTRFAYGPMEWLWRALTYGCWSGDVG